MLQLQFSSQRQYCGLIFLSVVNSGSVILAWSDVGWFFYQWRKEMEIRHLMESVLFWVAVSSKSLQLSCCCHQFDKHSTEQSHLYLLHQEKRFIWTYICSFQCFVKISTHINIWYFLFLIQSVTWENIRIRKKKRRIWSDVIKWVLQTLSVLKCARRIVLIHSKEPNLFWRASMFGWIVLFKDLTAKFISFNLIHNS